MSERSFGFTGEQAAAEYLIKNGYFIRERNFIAAKKEVDIIAEKDGFLVFVEVKLRREGTDYSGLEAVNSYKAENIRTAAKIYLTYFPFIELQFRFDVMEIIFSDGKIKITHIENAF